jgi:hypothetical protein
MFCSGQFCDAYCSDSVRNHSQTIYIDEDYSHYQHLLYHHKRSPRASFHQQRDPGKPDPLITKINKLTCRIWKNNYKNMYIQSMTTEKLQIQICEEVQ